ncbi:helix-turn-helix transcriptional regulator [Noviherbaspirillum autotrophicum]|nr:WYL domain-containing protein [Noviherbaspirillum autotrophicum]
MKLLSLLPVEKRGRKGVSAAELRDLLAASDYAASTRTIERDLAAMSSDERIWKDLGIALVAYADDEDGRLTLWYHAPKSKALLFHAMSEEDASMLALLDQELKHLLPPSAAQSFLHYLDRARDVLSRPGRRGSTRFKDRIRVIPEGPRRIPPEIDLAHIHEISDALFHEEQVDMVYRAAKNDTVRTYRLHPIGLLRQGMFYYLVAVKDELVACDPQPVQTFRVDRIDTIARRRHDPVSPLLPALDDAIARGVSEVSDGEMLALKLHVRHGEETRWIRNRFTEAPLAADQTISDRPDGSFDVAATVRNSRLLLNLLQSVAHYVDVIEPPALREKLDGFLDQAVALRRNRR